MIDNITITISKSEDQDEDGFMYDIYNCQPEDMVDGEDSMDGGFCTGTIEDAIDMAFDQAKTIIRNIRIYK